MQMVVKSSGNNAPSAVYKNRWPKYGFLFVVYLPNLRFSIYSQDFCYEILRPYSRTKSRSEKNLH